MFFGFALLVWTAMHIYLYWRFAGIPLFRRRIHRGVLSVTIGVLWALFPVSHAIEGVSAGYLWKFIEFIGTTWLGVAFLLFCCLLVADVFTAFGFFCFRRVAPRVRGYALILGGILSAVALVQGLRSPVVSNYEVRLKTFPADNDGLVLVVTSDLHLGSILGERWLTERVNQIEEQKANLVVLAGDIVEGHGEAGRAFVPALRQLTAPLGVWAVNGNHEAYRRSASDSRDRTSVLEDAGFHVLHDQWAEVRPGLIVAGVDDLTSSRRHGEPLTESVDHALSGRPAGATIFISHTPWLADRVAEHDVNLMLSAHTHDGQIWPFRYFVQISYPLMSGRYEIAGMPLIVCRGTGTWGPRMRLWRRGEIMRIVLRRSGQT